jgi:hypothetical protein
MGRSCVQAGRLNDTNRTCGEGTIAARLTRAASVGGAGPRGQGENRRAFRTIDRVFHLRDVTLAWASLERELAEARPVILTRRR